MNAGPRFIDLKGTRVGYLEVLQRVRTKSRRPQWRCVCTAPNCGKRITVAHNRLIHKTIPKTHCGCLRKGLPTRYSREYHAWWDARERCHNPKHPNYPEYGSQGIKMHPPWRNKEKGFRAFLDHIGARPSKRHSLDRVDPHRGYAPGNVRWATDKQQARNKKETKWVKHPSTHRPIKAADLAEELGVSYQRMRGMMIKKGLW